MSFESLSAPVSFDDSLTHEYVAPPSVPSHLEWIHDPNSPRGRNFLTRPSGEVLLQYNPEACLAPDPVSDAFGRLAAYSLGDYYDRGGYRDLPTRENMARIFGGIPDDYYFCTEPKPAKERVLDLGTGTGVFAVGMLDTVPWGHSNLQIDLIDNNVAALLTADTNIRNAIGNLPSAPEVNLRLASWLEGAGGKYQLIYFNPPYLDAEHEIRSSEAAMAPNGAIRVADPWQEYGKVVPRLPDYLDDGGMAIVRLPREPDGAMFDRLSELCADMREPFGWIFVEVVAGEQERQGFGLVLVNGSVPKAFSNYDYNVNYLGGAYKSYAEPSATLSMYSDAFCRVNRIKRPVMEGRLGLMKEIGKA
jgi:hypothetical protein